MNAFDHEAICFNGRLVPVLGTVSGTPAESKQTAKNIERYFAMKTETKDSGADVYGPAMMITDRAEAGRYFGDLVRRAMSSGHSAKKARQIVRDNLGYYAGYYGNETRERVERLFNCEHPIFGPIAKNGPPDPTKAFWAGAAMSAIDNPTLTNPVFENADVSEEMLSFLASVVITAKRDREAARKMVRQLFEKKGTQP